MDQKTQTAAALRNLPSVDRMLNSPEGLELQARIGLKRLTAVTRTALSELRLKMRQESGLENGNSAEFLLSEVSKIIHEKLDSKALSELSRSSMLPAFCYIPTSGGRLCPLQHSKPSVENPDDTVPSNLTLVPVHGVNGGFASRLFSVN